MQTVRLVGPNILTQETDAMEASGIYEMRSYTFYPAGVQVTFIFCLNDFLHLSKVGFGSSK